MALGGKGAAAGVEYGPRGGAYVPGKSGGKRYIPEMRQKGAGGEQLPLPFPQPAMLRTWRAERRSPAVRAEDNARIRSKVEALRVARQQQAPGYSRQDPLPGMENPDPPYYARSRTPQADAARERLGRALAIRSQHIAAPGPDVRQGSLGLDVPPAGRLAPHEMGVANTRSLSQFNQAQTPAEMLRLAHQFSRNDPRRSAAIEQAHEAAKVWDQVQQIAKDHVDGDFHKAAQLISHIESGDYDSIAGEFDLTDVDATSLTPKMWKTIAKEAAQEAYDDGLDEAVNAAVRSWDRGTDYESEIREHYMNLINDGADPSDLPDVGLTDLYPDGIEDLPYYTDDFRQQAEDQIHERISRTASRVSRELARDYESEQDEEDDSDSGHGNLSLTRPQDDDHHPIYNVAHLAAIFPPESGFELHKYTARNSGFEATIYKNGRKFCEITREQDGPNSVYHSYFKVDDQGERGGGHAARMMAHSLQQYADAGITKVRVCAALENGAYTWPRMGFDFAGRERERCKEVAKQLLLRNGWTAEKADARATEVTQHAWTFAAWHEPGLKEYEGTVLGRAKNAEDLKSELKKIGAPPGDSKYWHTGKRLLLGPIGSLSLKMDLRPGTPETAYVQKRFGTKFPWDNVNAPKAPAHDAGAEAAADAKRMHAALAWPPPGTK